jgi:hypothetical protein
VPAVPVRRSWRSHVPGRAVSRTRVACASPGTGTNPAVLSMALAVCLLTLQKNTQIRRENAVIFPVVCVLVKHGHSHYKEGV